MDNDLNPFVREFKLKVVKRAQKSLRADVADSDGNPNIVRYYESVVKTFLVESQVKRTLFHIGNVENVLFGEIGSAGRDLFLYLVYNLAPNTGTINLSSSKVCREMRISAPTYYKAIEQLEGIAVIRKKEKSIYWVNPHYVFCGDRINYYINQDEACIDEVDLTNRDMNKKNIAK